MSMEIKQNPYPFCVGNAAAMREALRYIIKQIDKNPDRLSSGHLLCIIGDKAEAAISAPARNCDLNLSEKSLWDKFEDYMHDCGLPFYSEPSGEDAFGWLLAPAEERKGECDEQK